MTRRSVRAFAAALLLAFSLALASAAPPGVEAMIPMRDGTRLKAVIWRENDDVARPVLLIRNPYGGTWDMAWAADRFGARGLTVVAQAGRGGGGSEGARALFLDDGWGLDPDGEHWDGWDTIQWLTEQPWCDGNVAMWGGSALGASAYYAAAAGHPALEAVWAEQAPWDLYPYAARPGGCFAAMDAKPFLALSAHPAVQRLVAEREAFDDEWRRVSPMSRLAEYDAPTMHLAGWYDPFVEGQIAAFQALNERGGPNARGRQWLIVGPWTHSAVLAANQGELVYPPNAAIGAVIHQFETSWIDAWLFGRGSVEGSPRVLYYVMGATDSLNAPGNVWREADNWPPPYRHAAVWLSADGSLQGSSLRVEQGERTYSSDPRRPAQSWSGRQVIGGGPRDQRGVEREDDDLLLYQSPPLNSPIMIAGPVRLELSAATTAVDVDWFVKLVDVYPDGRRMLIVDGCLRGVFRDGLEAAKPIVPGERTKYAIDVGNVAYAFGRGHRVQATISSALSPRFAPNPQNGMPHGDMSSPVVAENALFHGAPDGSRLLIPVAPDSDFPFLRETPKLRRLGGGAK